MFFIKSLLTENRKNAIIIGRCVSNEYARVVELADSLASGASALHGRAGSSPASRTKNGKSRSHYDCGIFLIISMLSGGFNSIKQYRCEHHSNAFISRLFSKKLMKTWGAELIRSLFI